MTNLVFGIITIVICALLVLTAGNLFFKREKYTTAVLLLVLVGLILRVYVGTDFYLHEWDERYHALVAKNLMQHPLTPTLYDHPILSYDYRNWTANHIWVHKQPVPLWSMALSMFFFGVNEIALRIPSIILSTIAIFFTYKIGALIFGREVGFIAAFLHSIHGLSIELTGGRISTDHIDIFFAFFTELAVLFALFYKTRNGDRKYLCLMGISIGIAILCKWLPALIVLPVWLLLVLDKDSQLSYRKIAVDLVMVILIVFTVFIPWQLYIHTAFPLEAAFESEYNIRHLFEGLEGHGKPFYYHINKIRIQYGELIYIPLLWWIWKSMVKVLRKKETIWLAFSCWLFIPLTFFSFAQTKMQAYTFIAAPVLFIITAVFWRYLRIRKPAHKWGQWISTVFVFLLLLLPVRYSIERIKPFSLQDWTPAWVENIKQLESIVKDQEKTILFGTDRPIETMFYCDNIIAYARLPEMTTIDSLIKEGFKVYVLDESGMVKPYQKR